MFVYFFLAPTPAVGIYFFVFLNFLFDKSRLLVWIANFRWTPSRAPAWFAEHSKQSNSTAACILTGWVCVAAVIESNESTVWQEAIINLCKKAHKLLAHFENFSEGFNENRSEPERLWLAHVGFRLLFDSKSFRSKSDTRQPFIAVLNHFHRLACLIFLTPYHGSLFALAFPFLRCFGKNSLGYTPVAACYQSNAVDGVCSLFHSSLQATIS